MKKIWFNSRLLYIMFSRVFKGHEIEVMDFRKTVHCAAVSRHQTCMYIVHKTPQILADQLTLSQLEEGDILLLPLPRIFRPSYGSAEWSATRRQHISM